MTHQPDFPFGCYEMWGRGILWNGDIKEHCCNLKPGHDGPHRCKCGTEHQWTSSPSSSSSSSSS